MQQAVSLAVFHYYLQHEELIDLVTIEKTIGGKKKLKYFAWQTAAVTYREKIAKVDVSNDLNEFCIPVETVLHAYISLVNELVSQRLDNCALTANPSPDWQGMWWQLAIMSDRYVFQNLQRTSLQASRCWIWRMTCSERGWYRWIDVTGGSSTWDRFDSIKYNVKEIEEVVYDISLRGLAGGNENKSKHGTLSGDETEPVAKKLKQECQTQHAPWKVLQNIVSSPFDGKGDIRINATDSIIPWALLYYSCFHQWASGLRPFNMGEL